MRQLALSFLILLIAQSATGMDKAGNYMAGGGIGAFSCPEFLNAMSKSRQLGGPESEIGGVVVDSFKSYVNGFETGFNYENRGIRDIFGVLGNPAGARALYVVETWCRDNPSETFALGVIALAKSLLPHAR